ELHEIEVEEGERPDRDVACDHAVAAVPERDEDPDERQRLERRQKDRVDVRNVERSLDDALRAAAEPRGEGIAGAETLDDADAGDRLLRERGQLTELLLIDLRPRGVPAR